MGGGETQCTMRQRACVATLLRALPTSRKRLRTPANAKANAAGLAGRPANVKTQNLELAGCPANIKTQNLGLAGRPANIKTRNLGLAGAPQTSKLRIWSLRGAPQTSKLRIWDLRGAPQTFLKLLSPKYNKDEPHTWGPSLSDYIHRRGGGCPSPRSRLTYSLPPRGSLRSGRLPWPRKYPGRR